VCVERSDVVSASERSGLFAFGCNRSWTDYIVDVAIAMGRVRGVHQWELSDCQHQPENLLVVSHRHGSSPEP